MFKTNQWKLLQDKYAYQNKIAHSIGSYLLDYDVAFGNIFNIVTKGLYGAIMVS